MPHPPSIFVCLFVCIHTNTPSSPFHPPQKQIALPTSAGYGTAFGGVTPLLASLNSAAPGVTVVNIDSGFGAAMAAWRILVNAARVREAALGGG